MLLQCQIRFFQSNYQKIIKLSIIKLSIIKLSVIKLSIIKLSIVKLSIIKLSIIKSNNKIQVIAKQVSEPGCC